ncbi:MAG: hypothetical protein RR550_03695, partial [Rikenellaceae bacterium]
NEMTKSILLLTAVVAVLFSCSEEDDETINQPVPRTERVGFYVLAEGTMNKNNSQLSFYDFATSKMTADYYGEKNKGEKLGDTANDLIVYGSKTYIVLNITNKIKVLNAYTGEQIGEIDMGKEGNLDAQPRYAVGANGRVYVSTFNKGVAVIDTLSLKVTKNIELTQSFCENIAQYKDQLYVACSGLKGDSFGGKGNLISVISLAEEKEVKTITVPLNPSRIRITKEGQLFVVTLGDYVKTDAQLSRVDLVSGVVTTIPDLKVNTFDISNHYAYTFNFSYIDYTSTVNKVDLKTLEVTPIMKSVKEIKAYGFRSIYGVCVNPATEDIYFLDEGQQIIMLNFKNDTETKVIFKGLGTRVNTLRFLDLTVI